MTTAAVTGRLPRRRSTLGLLAHQVRYEQLSFWRNPQSAIFTFVFPILFVVIMGALFGGVVVAAGAPAELGGRDRERVRITFTLPDGCPVSSLPLPAETRPDGLTEVETGNPTAALYQLTDWALRHGTLLDGLTVTRPSLEDVYLQLTRNGTQPGAPERRTR